MRRIDELFRKGGFAELDDDRPDPHVHADTEHPVRARDTQASDGERCDLVRPAHFAPTIIPMDTLSDLPDSNGRAANQHPSWQVTRPATITEPPPDDRLEVEHRVDNKTASLASTQRTSLLSPTPECQFEGDSDGYQSEAAADARRRAEEEWRREVECQTGDPVLCVESAYRPIYVGDTSNRRGDVVDGDDEVYGAYGEPQPHSARVEQG